MKFTPYIIKSDDVKYKAIAVEVRKYLYKQNIPAGAKLPSVRKFAALFGTSIYTMYSAMEELKFQGVIESKPQSGYFVSYDGWNTLFQYTPDWQRFIDIGFINKRRSAVEAEFFQENKDMQLSRFGPGRHLGANEYIKEALYSSMTNGRLDSALKDSDYRGAFSLREEICKYMRTLGIEAVPGNILITNGLYNSLALIRLAFMRAGTSFICENCFTPKVNSAYSSLGINKIHLPVDKEGIILDNLKATLQRAKNTFVSSIFGAMNPFADDITHGLSGDEYRKEFLTICNTIRVPVIEVDNYRPFFPPGSPLPLKSYDQSNSVLYVGSFTKIFNDFRLGWIVGPKDVIVKLADIKMQVDGRQNYIMLAVAEELLASGLFEHYARQLRSKLDANKKKAKIILENYLGDIAEINLNSYSTSHHIRFQKNVRVEKMYKNRENLQFTPGYILDDVYLQTVPISVSSMPLNRFEEAVQKFAELARKSINS
jgi:GntR family transcriptional regulator of abcA and norABC